MAGFDNETLYAENWDFRGASPVQAQATSEGQLPIATGVSPAIEVGTLNSPDSTINIGYSNPNITLISGSTLATTFTTDSGSATPNNKIIKILSGPNVSTEASSNTVTIKSNSQVTEKTADYTATGNDYFINCTTNSFTITLPSAALLAGKVFEIKNSGTGTITIDADGTETIDGDLTQSLIEDESMTVISNGSNWFIV